MITLPTRHRQRIIDREVMKYELREARRRQRDDKQRAEPPARARRPR